MLLDFSIFWAPSSQSVVSQTIAFIIDRPGQAIYDKCKKYEAFAKASLAQVYIFTRYAFPVHKDRREERAFVSPHIRSTSAKVKMRQEHQRLAESIVTLLQEAHFTALFAGGWVRDFMMGKPCQDIDIATSAHPEQVMSLFPRSIAVGAQFGVVRVLLDKHEFEVATFRSDAQ
jgi:hypothetical protein